MIYLLLSFLEVILVSEKQPFFLVLEFSFLQRRLCGRDLPKGELSKLKIQPRFILFFEVSDWLGGVKFQRWFKVAKMCVTQIWNAHLRKKRKYHICHRFCMVIVFNYWNANLFAPHWKVFVFVQFVWNAEKYFTCLSIEKLIMMSERSINLISCGFKSLEPRSCLKLIAQTQKRCRSFAGFVKTKDWNQ